MVAVTESAALEHEVLLTTDVAVLDEGDHRASLRIGGSLCAVTAAEHGRQLTDLVDRGFVELRIELTDLRLCTSHGLDLWDELQHRLDDLDGRLILAGATGVVRRVLEVATAPPVHFCPTVEPLAA